MKLWSVSYYVTDGGENKPAPFQYILADDFKQAYEKAASEENESLKLAKLELAVTKIVKAG